MVVGLAFYFVGLVEGEGWLVGGGAALKNDINCQLESVIEHARQHHFEQLGALLEAGVGVGLNEPAIEFAVDDEVVAKYFEALSPLLRIQLPFD